MPQEQPWSIDPRDAEIDKFLADREQSSFDIEAFDMTFRAYPVPQPVIPAGPFLDYGLTALDICGKCGSEFVESDNRAEVYFPARLEVKSFVVHADYCMTEEMELA